ncbi:CIA30 family protein [Flavivirga rizhaonensis]|uniref:CIA30 family protein n=1 Tax=Flavivirga rizhaonensis TaxID=2559571 RepID=A0A4S1DT44_9FLAO|nr:CIA30 family protein [Flavivirga rizhaonensis]TGV00568.1 CIA30 family protein [Flavivirga rizhaonensis]
MNNTSSQTICAFNERSDLTSWYVVNDGVMGGLSSSNLTFSDDHFGVFEGEVSIENNGGFTMMQHHCNMSNVKNYSKIILKIKGDGKTYQFRIKDDRGHYYSYVQNFDTSNNKETIELKLSDFKPAFRGRTLNMSPFQKDTIEQVAILIGNKKEERFRLEINEIILK